MRKPLQVSPIARATWLLSHANTLLMEFGMPQVMKHMQDDDGIWSFEFRYEVTGRRQAEVTRDRMVDVMAARWLTESRDWDGIGSFVVGLGNGLMATILFPTETNSESKGGTQCWAA